MTSITTNVKPMARITGSEEQDQNSISDPDQNLGFTCMFSSGLQATIFRLKSVNITAVKIHVAVWETGV